MIYQSIITMALQQVDLHTALAVAISQYDGSDIIKLAEEVRTKFEGR